MKKNVIPSEAEEPIKTSHPAEFHKYNYSILSDFSGSCLSLLCVLCGLCGKVKITNKPISESSKIALTPFNIRTKDYRRWTVIAKNKPNSNPFHLRPVPQTRPGIDICHIFSNTS